MKLGYPSTFEIYYKLPNKQEEDDLVLIMNDRQVMEMIEEYKGIEIWVIYVRVGIQLINLSDQTKSGNGNKNDNNQNDKTEDGNNQNHGSNSDQF